MPLALALLLSLVLHGAMLVALAISEQHPPPRTQRAPVPQVRLQFNSEPLDDSVTSVIEQPPLRSAPSPHATEKRGLQALQQLAQAKLTRHLYYPVAAVQAGLQGDVILLLELHANGSIRQISIARSSGHLELDEAARNAAAHLGRLPKGQASMLLPVEFRLD